VRWSARPSTPRSPRTRTLPSLHALRVANLTTGKAPRTRQVLAALRTRGGEDTLLTLITHYEFSPDFRTFHVLTSAEIWRRDRPEPGHRGSESTHGEDPDPLYRGTFHYVSEAIVAHGNNDAAARAWASAGAAALRRCTRRCARGSTRR
jgi:hypothetical protein